MKTKSGRRDKRWVSNKRLARGPRSLFRSGTRMGARTLAMPFRFRRRGASKLYGQIGPLEVRLAASRPDIRRAQRLRYQVFYEEMSARPNLRAQLRKRDQDTYDKFCDHLLVYDTSAPVSRQGLSAAKRPQVVVDSIDLRIQVHRLDRLLIHVRQSPARGR